MGSHYTPNLLSAAAFAIFVLVVLFSGSVFAYGYSLCGGFLYSAADFLCTAFWDVFRLLYVSFLLLLVRGATLLPVSTFVSVQHLFPLGMIVGFVGSSLLPGSICVLDPVLAFVALLLGTLCLMVYRLVLKTSVALGPLKDAAVQVQFISAPPALLQVPVPSLPQQPSQQSAALPMPASHVRIHSQPRFCPLSATLPLAITPVPMLPVVMVVQKILPFLDSFEVLYTTKGLYAYRTFTLTIFAWHMAYIAKSFSGFVPDLARRVVRTTAGRTVYPDLGTFMCPSSLKAIPSLSASPSSMSSVYRDIDSLLCSYCGLRRHEEANCHRKEKMMRRLRKVASAQNQWGWGDFGLWADDFVVHVCSDSFSI